MDSHSQETLRRVEENDATLTKLCIGNAANIEMAYSTQELVAIFPALVLLSGETLIWHRWRLYYVTQLLWIFQMMDFL